MTKLNLAKVKLAEAKRRLVLLIPNAQPKDVDGLMKTVDNLDWAMEFLSEQETAPSYDECESLAYSLCEKVHCTGDYNAKQIVEQSLYEFYQLCPAGFHRDHKGFSN
jgi:hypothetical protein